MIESPVSSGVVLVTGGTGSFGSTMVRRMLQTDVEEVRILSRDELKQHQLRSDLNDPRVRFYLGDVRDWESIDRATRGVDFVFHAAALKQVPSCEFFPTQAVKTNVFGSHNVIEASDRNGVRSVVCLGTDKAVHPVNAMGMSKAMMEKVAQAFARNNPTANTVVSMTRYGNVMASRGSVIPVFIEQIKTGKPLTVTDPHMTRFLMSLEDAVYLVEHAFVHAKPGDLYIRKAQASTVGDLAQALIELFDSDSKVTIIGTRHGEKLYETLATREELARAEDQGDYFRVPVDTRDLNYSEFFDEREVVEPDLDDYHSHNTERLDVEGVKKLLLGLPYVQKELAIR